MSLRARDFELSGAAQEFHPLRVKESRARPDPRHHWHFLEFMGVSKDPMMGDVILRASICVFCRSGFLHGERLVESAWNRSLSSIILGKHAFVGVGRQDITAS